MAKKVIRKLRKSDEKEKPIKPKFSIRLKRFYKNNRIYCILMGISFACIVLIILSLLFLVIVLYDINPIITALAIIPIFIFFFIFIPMDLQMMVFLYLIIIP